MSPAAIVTGGGTGIGRATALALHRDGFSVVIAGRRPEPLEETRALIGEDCATLAGDIREAEVADALIGLCLERHGRVDVLHHNVGIGSGDGWTENLEIEAWERIMRVNAGSAALLAKAVVPPMRDQGAGAITNVSSIAAVCATITRLGNPPLGYKMSKAALNALTQSLAQTYAGDGIRANAILPGLIDTPMGVDAAAREFGLDRDRYAAVRDETVPLKGGMGSAWDVANAAVFLASDEARFVTGVLLPVDGGQSTRIG